MVNTTKIVIGGIADYKDVIEFNEALEKADKSFDEYIIAYIDFLGMTDRMKEDSSFESLMTMKFLLSNTKFVANYVSKTNDIKDFEIKLFSDNVVIAQKIDRTRLGDQIISMVNLLASLQFWALMQFNFWLRGGITIGNLFIDDTVVWGTGLIDAYKLESTIAYYPRIVFNEKVIKEYEQYKKESLNLFALIKKDCDGFWFIDFLKALPNLEAIPIISDSLRENVQKYADYGDRVKQKINWMINYFNSQCVLYKERGDYEKYVIAHL